MEQIREKLLFASALILAILCLVTLIRAVLGPRFTDRILAVNVINTLVVAELGVLSVWLNENFLVDVALVYALLSFLTVVLVSRILAARHHRHIEKKPSQEGHDVA
jgi:multicomponent Na+:H+ antiporter subunit F